ncbi:GNAT family N-acetyltransferase [Caldalkalibacillus salinus]|uniref:GNAT family N-acetyltransferase n=1 Tax=Caldalkalibacillus salinus TaxID=2803787 RepID=UPI001920F4C0|nr:GNAT family protein [Caldalkalibacillus salinus]
MSLSFPYVLRLSDNTQVKIRRAQPTDVRALIDLFRSVMLEEKYLLTTYEEFSLTEEKARQWVQQANYPSSDIILIVEKGSEIIGSLDFTLGQKTRLRHLGTIGMCVHKEWRGRGVGSQLLALFLAWAEEQPTLEKICLEVFSTNKEAIQLYEKHGFVIEGIRKEQVKMKSEYIDLVTMGRFVPRSDKHPSS